MTGCKLKNIFLFILISTGITSVDVSHGAQYWIKSYGGEDSNEWGYTLQTSDGGHIIATDTDSFGAGGLDIFLIKVDGNGNLMWAKTYGGKSFDEPHFIQE